MALVNKGEMARLLKVSLPTLSAWIEKWPNFPIDKRGTNGQGYEFDAAAVSAFLQAKRNEQIAAGEEKDQALKQLIFPGMEPDAPEQTGLSIKDQRELLQIRKLQRLEFEQNRELVSAIAVAALLTDAIASWNARCHAAIRAAGREFDLPATVIAGIDSRLADAQREFVEETTTLLAAKPHESASAPH